jgi:hypothetical protein
VALPLPFTLVFCHPPRYIGLIWDKGDCRYARTLRDAKLDTREARQRLKVRGKPYWRLIEPGLHLGYRRLGSRPGSWCIRRYVGPQTYVVDALDAVADDNSNANGHDVLDFKQAQRRALDHKPKVATGALTVKGALDAYLADLQHRGKPTQEVRYRIDAQIVPALGTVAVEALSTDQIRVWHAGLARAPARHGRARMTTVRRSAAVGQAQIAF